MRVTRVSRRVGLSRAVVLLAVSTGLVIVTSHVADAALFLLFDRTSGPPGTVVHVHTGGNGACASCLPRMPLYFAPTAVADAIKTPDDPRLVPVGHLTVDGRRNGRAVLIVPNVPNGRYVVMAYCKPCAPFSAGRVILPVGPFPNPFRVLGSPAEGSTPIWPWIIGGSLGARLVALMIVWWFRSHRARPSMTAEQKAEG